MNHLAQRTSRRHARGHTLIEVSIAAGMLTFGALGLVPLIVTGNQGLSSSSKTIQASSLAESKLAQLTSLDYNSAALAAAAYTEVKNLSATGVPLNSDGSSTSAYGCDQTSDGHFARSWTITDIAVPTGGALLAKEIAVTVCWWDNMSKAQHSVTTTGGITRPR